MGACKRDVVIVIKMGAYVHGVLIFYGCLLSRFYGIFIAEFSHVAHAYRVPPLSGLNQE